MDDRRALASFTELRFDLHRMSSLVTSEELTSGQTHQLRDTFLALADEATRAGSGDEAVDRVGFLERLLGRDLCRRLGIYRIPSGFLLSVVMPVFNEAKTVLAVIRRVRRVGLPCEIVIVDDGSTDGTRDVLQQLDRVEPSANRDLRIVFHERNQGKGAALKTGFAHVSGDAVVIQDADMEYDPRDFHLLLQPIIDGTADVVYGSRFGGSGRPDSPLWHQLGNQFITFLCNLRTELRFSDVETCYKMFRREVLDRIAPGLREKRFGIEIELTAKLARMKSVRMTERPISYVKRTYAEGKKIGWRDALRAVWCMLRY